MNLEKGKISTLELSFLMLGVMLGALQVTGSAAVLAKQDTGLTILAAFFEGLMMVLIWLRLMGKFPDKNLVQINEIVFGPFLGKLITISYLWFFFHITSANLILISNFISIILPETPLIVFTIVFTIVCASAVRNGLEIIARCSVVLIPITIMVIIVSFFLLLNRADFSNFLPLFQTPPQEFFKTTHIVSTVTYGEVVVFLMLIPFITKGKGDKVLAVRKALILSFGLATFSFLVVIIRNISVLGSTISILYRPSFQAVRLINIAEFLSRMEILIVLNELTMSFLKISLMYYVVVLGLAQLFKMKSYLPLVLPTGGLLINISILLFDFSLEYNNFATEVFPYYSLPFEVFIPLLTIVITKLRGLPKEREGSISP